MARYQLIYWRDVPTQVRVKAGRKRASVMLPQRFQQTMYRAAYRAKAINGEAYSDGFRNGEWHEIAAEAALGKTLDTLAQSLARVIDIDHTDEQLSKLALNKGYDLNKRIMG